MDERSPAVIRSRIVTLPALRQQLREKFPEAHRESDYPPSLSSSSSRLPAFPTGALSELTPVLPASGLSLILAELLQENRLESPLTTTAPHLPPAGRKLLALIDGRDSFDPASYSADSCSRLLWIRCRNGDESLRCCDLLLHDASLPLLILDLLLNPLEELRRIPSSSWYRLRNLARQSGTSLLIFTPRHLIPCASLHLTFNSAFTLADLERNRDELKIVCDREETAVRSS